MDEELTQLQNAWITAKEKEDKAKDARVLLESMILEKIGYTAGNSDFKSWKDKIKITFSKKEEYDNAELLKLFRPEQFSDAEFPFRIKLEPDVKKMTDFKVVHNKYYMEKLAPLCKIKFSKPSFSTID